MTLGLRAHAFRGWARHPERPHPSGLTESVSLRRPVVGRYLLCLVAEELLLIRCPTRGLPHGPKAALSLPLGRITDVTIHRRSERARANAVVDVTYLDPEPSLRSRTVRYVTRLADHELHRGLVNPAAAPVTIKLDHRFNAFNATPPGPGRSRRIRWSHPSPR